MPLLRTESQDRGGVGKGSGRGVGHQKRGEDCSQETNQRAYTPTTRKSEGKERERGLQPSRGGKVQMKLNAKQELSQRKIDKKKIHISTQKQRNFSTNLDNLFAAD